MAKQLNLNAIQYKDQNGSWSGIPAFGSDSGSAYELPVASPTVLGGVMPATKTSAMTQAVGVDSSGKLYTEPGASEYTLPVATAETLGGVKPVAKTEDMTQSVGVDAMGALFTAPGSGGGGGGWVKRAHYIWDVNKEYQPLTLDFATGEMTFAEAPPTNKCVWPTPNMDKAKAIYNQLPYAAIPNEFMNASYTSTFAQGTAGYKFGGVASVAEGGGNVNVDASAFHFEHSTSAPSFTGLNSKHVKVKTTFPGGNVAQSNGYYSYYVKLSNGTTVAQNLFSVGNTSGGRVMNGVVEQEFIVLGNGVSSDFAVKSKLFRERTNQTQNATAYELNGVCWMFVTGEDVTITDVMFAAGNGNHFPSNGTLVEVFEYVD